MSINKLQEIKLFHEKLVMDVLHSLALHSRALEPSQAMDVGLHLRRAQSLTVCRLRESRLDITASISSVGSSLNAVHAACEMNYRSPEFASAHRVCLHCPEAEHRAYVQHKLHAVLQNVGM